MHTIQLHALFVVAIVGSSVQIFTAKAQSALLPSQGEDHTRPVVTIRPIMAGNSAISEHRKVSGTFIGLGGGHPTLKASEATSKAFAGGAKCDGKADDTAAFDAAIAAQETLKGIVFIPPGKTCRITRPLTLSGTVSLVGDSSTLYFDPASAIPAGLQIRSASMINVSGLNIRANARGPGVGEGIAVKGKGSPTEHGRVHLHDLNISGFQGCTGGDYQGAIILDSASNIEINDIATSNNGCPDSGSFPGGFEIESIGSPSYRLEIHNNTLVDYQTNFGIGLFNANDSSVTNNFVDESTVPPSPHAPHFGYGVMIYGTVVCKTGQVSSISKASNRVEVTMREACSKLLPGELIESYGVHSDNASLNGEYRVSSVSGKHITGAWVAPEPALDGEGVGGGISYAGQNNKIIGNTIVNASGMGIYLQSTSDTVVSANIIQGSCLNFNDSTLPCGGIAVNNGFRPLIVGNSVNCSGLDGVVLSTTYSANVTGNTIRGIQHNGIRLRASESNALVADNNITGAKIGINVSGPTKGAQLRGNIISHFTGDGIVIANVCAWGERVIGNSIDGQGTRDATAILDVEGGGNLFAGNTVRALPGGTGFDVRTRANSLVNNSCDQLASGYCYRLRGAASDNQVTGGVIYKVKGTGIADAGIRNSFQNIEDGSGSHSCFGDRKL